MMMMMMMMCNKKKKTTTANNNNTAQQLLLLCFIFTLHMSMVSVVVEGFAARPPSISRGGSNKKNNKEDQPATTTTADTKKTACEAVTATVSINIQRKNPCVDTNKCIVVVKADANTYQLCSSVWSPYFIWDGSSCVCRCELFGGRLNMSAAVPAETCIVNGISVEMYNNNNTDNNNKSKALSSNSSSYLAPVKCGTWMGALDSVWNQSWFSSSCFSILKNRFTPSIASVSECDVDTYTTGCRYLDSGQKFVPECRKKKVSSSSSNSSSVNDVLLLDEKCGVNVPCPDRNPCGLGRYIETNMDNNRFSACNTQTHLVLNASVTKEENCYSSWNEYAFWLDGFCVSSCGRIDNQCVLQQQLPGTTTTTTATVPRCVTVRDYNHDNAILSNSPEICSVPMPYNSFAGFRNAFYGMSRDIGSKCLAVTSNCSKSPSSSSPSSSYMCVKIEGLDLSPLVDPVLINTLPFCMGDPNIQCKIEYPCDGDTMMTMSPIQPSDCGVLGTSYLIYTAMGTTTTSNYYCNDWLMTRDWITIFFFVVVFFLCLYGFYSETNHSDSNFRVWIVIAVVGMACAIVWEFFLVLGGISLTVYLFYQNACCGLCGRYARVSSTEIPPPPPSTQKEGKAGITDIRIEQPPPAP
jgi:hypothetical protein